MKKLFAIVLTLALLVTGCGVMAMAEAAETTDTDTAVESLHFVTTDVFGNEVNSDDLFSQYDLTLVNVWETWCGPCRGELATLEQIYEELKDKGIGVIGVSVLDESFDFTTSDLDELLALREENGVTYPMVAYTEDFLPLELGSRPLSFFVDREGNIVYLTGSLYSEEELASYREQMVEAYLSGCKEAVEQFNNGECDSWKDSDDEDYRSAYEFYETLAQMDEETMTSFCEEIVDESMAELEGDTFEFTGSMEYDDWMDTIRKFYAAATGNELA